MAKREWAGLSDGQIAKRVGRVLGLAFVEDVPVGLGGASSWLAEVGEDAFVALEVETRHTHPAENVLRYWPWLERTRRRVVLVHAIAPDARKRESPRADLTKWLGAMMERVIPGRFTYCRVELGSAGQDEQLAAVADAIAAVTTSAHERKLAPGL